MLLVLCASPRAVAHAQAGVPVESVVGTWRGTSICRPVGKPACHDEIAVYHFRRDSSTAALTQGSERLIWQANKVMNGAEEEMGTMTCTYDRTTGTLLCLMRDWRWAFHASTGASGSPAGDATLSGTLTNAAGTIWRDVRVTRVSSTP